MKKAPHSESGEAQVIPVQPAILDQVLKETFNSPETTLAPVDPKVLEAAAELLAQEAVQVSVEEIHAHPHPVNTEGIPAVVLLNAQGSVPLPGEHLEPEVWESKQEQEREKLHHLAESPLQVIVREAETTDEATTDWHPVNTDPILHPKEE